MKSIFLPPNHFALVDDEDEDLKELSWTFSGGYAASWYTDSSGKRRRRWLHRMVLERMLGHAIPNGMQCDHLTSSQIGKKARLDNRRENLRLATKSQNQANKGPQINSLVTGCKGISLRASRFEVRIRCGFGRRLYLGRYKTLFTAMTVYGFAHRLLWGEFSTESNVPDPTPELQACVMSGLKPFGVEV